MMVLKSAIRIEFIGPQKVRIVSCQILIRYPTFQTIQIVVWVFIGPILPLSLLLRYRLLEVLLKVLFKVITQLAALILQLFSIGEREEVKFVFTIVLPLAILLFFLCLQKLIVISHKLISFVHK